MQTKSKTVRDRRVSVTEMGVFAAQDLGVAIANALGTSTEKIEAMIGDVEFDQSGAAVASLLPLLLNALRRLDAKQLRALQLQSFATTKVVLAEGTPQARAVDLLTAKDVELAFGSDLIGLWQSWLWSLEVIYADFFAYVRPLLERLLERMKTAALAAGAKVESPSTSPSPSSLAG